MPVGAPHAHLGPSEANGGCHIPYQSYGQLWAAMMALGTEPSSSASAAHTVIYWAITPASQPPSDYVQRVFFFPLGKLQATSGPHSYIVSLFVCYSAILFRSRANCGSLSILVWALFWCGWLAAFPLSLSFRTSNSGQGKEISLFLISLSIRSSSLFFPFPFPLHSPPRPSAGLCRWKH